LSRALTGPVRALRRSRNTPSLSSMASFSLAMSRTSEITLSSWAMSDSRRFTWDRLVSRVLETVEYQDQLPAPTPTSTSRKRTICFCPSSHFFVCSTGRRLIRIMASLHLLPPQGETDGHRRHGPHVIQVREVETLGVDVQAGEGIEDLHRCTGAIGDHPLQGGDLRRTAGEVDLVEPTVDRIGVEVERALDLAGDLAGHASDHPLHLVGDDGIRVLADSATDLERLGLLVGDTEILLDLLGDQIAPDRDVADEGGHPLRND